MRVMLQLDVIPSWLEGTKNCFTDGFRYRAISQSDENQTIWSSMTELDSVTGQVVTGHDIFALIALSWRLDAAIALDTHRTGRTHCR